MQSSGCALIQGRSHTVCEDYSIHGYKGGLRRFGIVSDGCSNGGGPRLHTDWGSRFLSKAAENLIDRFGLEYPGESLRSDLKEAALKMLEPCRPRINESCLLATLLVVTEHTDRFNVTVYGDGVYGARRHDGTWKIYEVHCEGNAPAYLVYTTDQWGSRPAVIQEYTTDLQGNNTFSQREVEFSWGNMFLEENFSFSEFDMAFVATDGMSSYVGPDFRGIPTIAVMDHWLDFGPLIADGFVERQARWLCHKSSGKTFAKNRWVNEDDVAISAVYLPRPQKESDNERTKTVVVGPTPDISGEASEGSEVSSGDGIESN